MKEKFIYLKKYDEAIICYDKAIEVNPKYANVYIAKGNIHFDLMKYDEAIKCYNRGIKIDPNSAWAWHNKGLALYNLKKYDEAIICYDKAIEVDTNLKWAWQNKGIALNYLDKYEDAIKCYDRAMEIDPNDAFVLNNKGDSLQAIGNYLEAERCYDKAIQFFLKSSDINKSNAAESLIKARKYDEGRRFASQLLNDEQDIGYQCINKFLILSSYLLEGNVIDGNKELVNFFDYYKNLNKDIIVGEEWWDFRGLIIAINNSSANLQIKFILITLIDLIRGKINRHKLTFFSNLDRANVVL